ncbi:MAG: XAC2610-related protein [Cyclobacteriaceae bacterium]
MKKWFFVFCMASAACQPGTNQRDEQGHVMELQALEEDSLAQDELHNSDYGIYFFDYPVKDNLVYSLQLHYPDRKARIYPQQNGPVIQEMELSEDLNFDDGYYAENPEAIFSLQDVNFDGYVDISFLRMTGVANTWSDFYLYDPEKKRWMFNESLSEYPNITLDEKTQTLSFYNKGGYGGAWYESGTVKWEKGDPLMIRKEEQTSAGEEDSESFIRTIWMYADGEMKVASKVHISEIETGEKQCLLEGDWEEFDRTPFLVFAKTDEQVTRVDGRQKGCR